MPVIKQPLVLQFGHGDLLPMMAQKDVSETPTAVAIMELIEQYEVGQPVMITPSDISKTAVLLEFKTIESLEVVMNVFQQLHDIMSAGNKLKHFVASDIPMYLEDGVLVFDFDAFFKTINLVNPQQMSFAVLEQHLVLLMQHIYAQHVFATEDNLPEIRKAFANTLNNLMLDILIVKKG